MTSVKRPVFSYQPLIGQDAIRLILLHPAPTFSTELECSMEHAILSDFEHDLISHYTALSYVWGDPADKKQIIVNGCSFHITPNLESALRHLRDKSRVLRIWVDALCINQSDVAERNQQVQQMGSIYSLAQHTVIYLGDASVKSDSVFINIGSLLAHSNIPLPLAILASKCDDAAWEILYEGIQTQILARPWFSRVWVFQELLLSRDPWVQCGTKRLKWADLCQVSFLARDGSNRLRILKDKLKDWGDRDILSISFMPDKTIADLPKGVGALGCLEDMNLARRKFQDYIGGNGIGNTLLALLALRRGLGVSDSRDMIYVHLGVASDSISGNLGFKVDYTKGYQQLFTDITRYFLEMHNDYRILSHIEDVDPLRRRLGLPSWVPDWTSNKVLDLHENPKPNYHKTSTAIFSISSSAEGKYQLTCRGWVFGKITMVGTNVLGFTHLKSDEIKKSWATLLGDSEHQTLSFYSEKIFKRGSEKFGALVEEVAKAAGFQGSSLFRAYFKKYDLDWHEGLQKISQSVKSEGSLGEIKLHPTALVSALPFEFFPPNGLG
ncbi:hypothetical protein B7463_g2103, partial [Scytalidium lignicola]